MLGLTQLSGFAVGGADRLHSETITSNRTWVAPAGCFNLITLYGIGQNGSAAYWQPNGSVGYELMQGGGGTTYGNSIDWSALYSRHQANIAACAAGGSGERSVTFYTTLGSIMSGDNSYYLVWDNLSETRTIRGLATETRRGGWKTSGQIVYADMTDTYNGFLLHAEMYEPAQTGSDTTGFGYTFTGGVGGPASGTTYNNVAVTPGASYSLVVPSGGSITITYLADA